MTIGKTHLIIIGVVLAVIVCMAQALVRVENERYAMSTGMCANKTNPALPLIRNA